MTKFVKLTLGDSVHWVNLDQVCEIRLLSNGGSRLVFSPWGPDARTMPVNEAPEEIAALAAA